MVITNEYKKSHVNYNYESMPQCQRYDMLVQEDDQKERKGAS